VAAFLAAGGIKKGERVAIFLPNIAHYPAVYFGILKAGAVCVTCNPLYTASELNYQLKDSGVRTLFCMDHPQFYPTTVEAIKGTEYQKPGGMNPGIFFSMPSWPRPRPNRLPWKSIP